MSIQRYPKYKDSGVEWLGEVPEHWDVVPIKWLSPVKRGASPRPIDDPKYFDDDGEFGWVRIADVSASDGVLRETTQRLSELGSSLSVKVAPGDLFVSIAGTVGKPCISAINACIHDGFVYFPELRINPQFLYRVFKSGACYGGLGKLGTQLNLNTDTIGSIRIALPPPDELERVEAFLENETAKIDALVDEQRRLMELLKEKRQAVISHAVTKGLNPHTPMKPSGIEWLGEVPEHWRATRLRFLFKQEKRQNQVEKPVLSVYRDYGVILKDSRDDNLNKTPDDLSAYQLVNREDLVVNKMKAWQGSLGISEWEGITSPDYIVFTPQHSDYSPFLHLLLRSHRMVSVYRSISNGIRPAQWRLEPDRFLDLSVFLPPRAEQVGIISHLREFTSQSDALVADAERSIGLLHERRTALISAAVTGQIDVREESFDDTNPVVGSSH